MLGGLNGRGVWKGGLRAADNIDLSRKQRATREVAGHTSPPSPPSESPAAQSFAVPTRLGAAEPPHQSELEITRKRKEDTVSTSCVYGPLLRYLSSPAYFEPFAVPIRRQAAAPPLSPSSPRSWCVCDLHLSKQL